jgi:DNA excision repair protein ERCC-2
MIEPRVRGILSKSVQHFMFDRAASELGSMHNALFSDDTVQLPVDVPQPSRNVIHEEIAGEKLDEEALKDLYNILLQFSNAFNNIITRYIQDNHAGWSGSPDAIDDRIQIPLRDPSQPEDDRLTEWIDEKNIPKPAIRYLDDVSGTVSDVLSEASATGSTNQSITDVASLLNEWIQRNNTQYFRSIELTKRDTVNNSYSGWKRVFNAEIKLNNVMPRKVISSTLQQFGAGVLMSATLAPLDVYREVIGLDYVSEIQQRVVKNSVYTADFPLDNRLSISLDLPKFTRENRGEITANTETRQQYAQAIRLVAKTTPGNVLVCMPSYKEGRWAASLLTKSNDVSKEVLLDESSSEEKTKRLKQYFIGGDPKVLVTSLRGTLTEGVDYDGDKLLGCIVCGVPIENVGSPRTKAVRTAYEQKFGGVGFHYGLTVPAVRKTRQALGRVIRGTEDVGVRVVADRRYTGSGQGSVRHFMSQQEQNEYDVVDDVNGLASQLSSFWK